MRIIYTNPATGNLCVVVPVYDSIEQGFYADEAELLAACVERNVPDGVAHRVVEDDEIPSARLFRNAWADDGATVAVDMETARGMQMDEIRVDRDAQLVELDVTFMRAVEDGDADAQAEVGAAKQVLRDIPQTFDLAGYTTAEDLNEAWPADLPRSPES
jgi:hypothetical protein